MLSITKFTAANYILNGIISMYSKYYSQLLSLSMYIYFAANPSAYYYAKRMCPQSFNSRHILSVKTFLAHHHFKQEHKNEKRETKSCSLAHHISVEKRFNVAAMWCFRKFL